MTDSQHGRDDGGAKLKRQETTDDILDVALSRDRKTRRSEAERPQATTRAQNAKFASIESNPFYAIVFGEGEPEAKERGESSIVAEAAEHFHVVGKEDEAMKWLNERLSEK